MTDETDVDARARLKAEEADTESRRLVTQQSIDASNRPYTGPGAGERQARLEAATEEIGRLKGELAGIQAEVGGSLEMLRALREPIESIEKAVQERDDLRSILREIRGELAGIRTRLDSLVAIEKQLGYQGQRIAAMERRVTTLVETKLKAPESAPALDTARSWGAGEP